MITRIVCIGAIIALAVACAPAPAATPTRAPGAPTPAPAVTAAPTPPSATIVPGGTVARSDKARVTGVAAPGLDLSALAAGNADFAFALYGQLRANSAGNFMVSPH